MKFEVLVGRSKRRICHYVIIHILNNRAFLQGVKVAHHNSNMFPVI